MSRMVAHERLRHLNVPSRYDVKLAEKPVEPLTVKASLCLILICVLVGIVVEMVK